MDQAHAVAAIPFNENGATFVTPLFARRSTNHLWIQDIDGDDRIRGFLEVDPNIRGVIPVSNPIQRAEGDRSIYGIRNRAGSIILGEKEELAGVAKRVFVESPDRLYLRRALARFANDRELLALASNAITRRQDPLDVLDKSEGLLQRFYRQEYDLVVAKLVHGSSILVLGPAGIGKTTLVSFVETEFRRRTDLAVVTVKLTDSKTISALAFALINASSPELREKLAPNGDVWSFLNENRALIGITDLTLDLLNAVQIEERENGRRLVVLIDDLGEHLRREEQTTWQAIIRLLTDLGASVLITGRSIPFSMESLRNFDVVSLAPPSQDMLESALSETFQVDAASAKYSGLTDLIAAAMVATTPIAAPLIATLFTAVTKSSISAVSKTFGELLLQLLTSYFQTLKPEEALLASKLVKYLSKRKSGSASFGKLVDQSAVEDTDEAKVKAADVLGDLMRKGVVRIDSDGTTRFTHPLVRDAATTVVNRV